MWLFPDQILGDVEKRRRHPWLDMMVNLERRKVVLKRARIMRFIREVLEE